MEVNIIWIVVLAVVSIVVLITLTTTTFRPAAYKIYCDIYLKITKFFSGTESLPDFCRANIKPEIQVVEIKDQDKKIFSRKLLSYIISCWKETEILEFYKTHTCYELHLLKMVDNVTEEDVTNVLIKEDLCKSIENSDYNCGVMDQIIWDVGEGVIRDQKIILIEYNDKLEAIRVIG